MVEFRLRLGGTLVGLCAAMAAGLAFAGIDSGSDASIRPGDDFYNYANNAWLESTRLPDGVASLDTTTALRAENARRVRDLIEHASGTPDARRIADYHASWLDRDGIEARGLTPLSHDLASLAAITDRRALAAYLGRTLRLDDGTNVQTESLWGVWIHQGFHDPAHYSAHLVQGGLGLGDKDDYLDPARRDPYRTHVAHILKLAGFDQPETRAARVLDLEIAIAATHASRADTDDVYKTDNTWHRADFTRKAPGLDWNTYFAAARLGRARSFVVWQPGAVIGGSRLVATQPLETWRDYLAFHLIEHYTGVLPAALSDAHTDAIAATQVALGDAVGRLYVQRYFPPSAKAAVTAMVANLRAAFAARLTASRWMSTETRAKALAKLAALRIGLAYPERWVDYSKLTVVRGDAFGNLRRAEAFAYARAIAKLSRPVDPHEWPVQLHPQMVGAILDISPNTMEFAAGLFQPPYFDPKGDAAANYGSAGAGISHEISHSFDELGNQYDARGRLVRWWSPGDLARYRAATAPLIAQLDACAHGEQILGESAADLAGLAVAHDAYLRSLHGHPDAIKDGLTGDQRFFIAFARRWRRLQTDAALRRQIETDTHAPPQCRSNLVRNHDAWVRAFAVKPGDKLYVKPGERILVW